MFKVSVIIPTYNRAKYITRALDSVLAQTNKNLEIIVVDDGSKDNTKDVLRPYLNKIIYLWQENKGISVARNRAIQQAAGEYIAFLDSDDFWAPEKLEEQVKILDQNQKVGIVYGRMPILNEKNETIGMKPAGVSGKNFKELLELWGDLPTSTIMTRRECFEKVGMFDVSLGTMEDIDMWIRISKYYDLHEIENKPLAFYCRHDEQITKNKIKVYEGLVKIYTKVCKDYVEAPKELMNKRILENQYLLARAYYDEGYYKKSFSMIRKSLSQNLLVGALFINNTDQILAKALKLIKPYGLLMLSFIKSIRS